MLISNLLGLCLTVGFGFIVISHYGLMGAAWSRAAVHIFVVALETWYVTKRLGFTVPYRTLALIALAAGLCGSAAHVVIELVEGVLSLSLAIPIGALVYGLVLRWLGVLNSLDSVLLDKTVESAPRVLQNSLRWSLRFLSGGRATPHIPSA
jgi:O-antigen/teichoic acid export membrane protein